MAAASLAGVIFILTPTESVGQTIVQRVVLLKAIAQFAILAIMFIMEDVTILAQQPLMLLVQPAQHAQAIVMHVVMEAPAQHAALAIIYTKANAIALVQQRLLLLEQLAKVLYEKNDLA